MNDTFRKTYKPLNETNQNLIIEIKEAAEEVEKLLTSIPSCREMSLAMTNLEQCTMWATKAIVLFDEKY